MIQFNIADIIECLYCKQPCFILDEIKNKKYPIGCDICNKQYWISINNTNIKLLAKAPKLKNITKSLIKKLRK